MLVTLSGIVTLVRPVQLRNALCPMLVTLLPIVTLVSPVQCANVPFLMIVTLSGIVTVFSPVHSSKAAVPMLVTLFGTVTLVRPAQLENALLPMLVTLSGIVTLVISVHLKNAQLPILVTPSWIETDFTRFPHGADVIYFLLRESYVYVYSAISPVPLIVSRPLLSSVQVTLLPSLPQFPELTMVGSAADTLPTLRTNVSTRISAMAKMPPRFPFLFIFPSP